MINIDRFDRLEAVIKNRSRFSHLGAMLLAGGVPLGVEMGVQAYFESDPVSVGLLIVCAAAVAFGLLFFFLAWLEGKSYTAVKDSLFSQDKLLSDETITHYEDGSTTRVVHPVTVSSRSCKTQIKVHRKAI